VERKLLLDERHPSLVTEYRTFESVRPTKSTFRVWASSLRADIFLNMTPVDFIYGDGLHKLLKINLNRQNQLQENPHFVMWPI
jgi:hypothetical protein